MKGILKMTIDVIGAAVKLGPLGDTLCRDGNIAGYTNDLLKRMTEDSLTFNFRAISVEVIKQASAEWSRIYLAIIFWVLVRLAL